MKTRLSAGWSHDPAHYKFHRATPPSQRYIPFVEEAPGPSWGDILSALILVAFVAILVTAPWWSAWIP